MFVVIISIEWPDGKCYFMYKPRKNCQKSADGNSGNEYRISGVEYFKNFKILNIKILIRNQAKNLRFFEIQSISKNLKFLAWFLIKILIFKILKFLKYSTPLILYSLPLYLFLFRKGKCYICYYILYWWSIKWWY